MWIWKRSKVFRIKLKQLITIKLSVVFGPIGPIHWEIRKAFCWLQSNPLQKGTVSVYRFSGRPNKPFDFSILGSWNGIILREKKCQKKSKAYCFCKLQYSSDLSPIPDYNLVTQWKCQHNTNVTHWHTNQQQVLMFEKLVLWKNHQPISTTVFSLLVPENNKSKEKIHQRNRKTMQWIYWHEQGKKPGTGKNRIPVNEETSK